MNLLEVRCTTNSGLPFTDASGAPCVVTVIMQGTTLRYALDFIRVPVLNLLNPRAGITKAGYRKAAEFARTSYLEWLKGHVDTQWFAANAAMYKEAS